MFDVGYGLFVHLTSFKTPKF